MSNIIVSVRSGIEESMAPTMGNDRNYSGSRVQKKKSPCNLRLTLICLALLLTAHKSWVGKNN